MKVEYKIRDSILSWIPVQPQLPHEVNLVGDSRRGTDGSALLKPI